PVVEDRAAVEEDHGLAAMDVPGLVRGKVGALEEAQDVELALDVEGAHRVLVGKIPHHEDDVTGQRAELLRQAGTGVPCQGLDVGERGRLGIRPVHGASVPIPKVALSLYRPGQTGRRCMTKLDAAARSAALAKLPQWKPVGGRDAITRKFEFKDFNA